MPGIEVQQMPAWVCAEIVAVTRQVPNSFLPGKVYPAEEGNRRGNVPESIL
jgi:hypothetical protein